MKLCVNLILCSILIGELNERSYLTFDIFDAYCTYYLGIPFIMLRSYIIMNRYTKRTYTYV